MGFFSIQIKKKNNASITHLVTNYHRTYKLYLNSRNIREPIIERGYFVYYGLIEYRIKILIYLRNLINYTK